VQGLRFKPRDVKAIWRDADGEEHLVNIRRRRGKGTVGDNGVPITFTPRDLKRMLDKGETIDVYVRPGSFGGRGMHDIAGPEEFRLKLDPRKMEGSPGRESFDADQLAGLSPVVRRALALEQMRTVPYGEKYHDQAIPRILWSIEHLTDSEISSMLEGTSPKEASDLSPEARRDRSSTPAELATFLLSDERIVSALISGGKHSSLTRIADLSALSSAMLGYAGRPALEIFEERANVLLLESADPVVRRHAVRHVRNPWMRTGDGKLIFPTGQDMFVDYLKNEPDPDARIAVIGRLMVGRPRFVQKLALKDRDPRVRMRALEYFDAQEDIAWLERDAAMFDAALRDADEQVRLRALELIENDELLFKVAEDTSVDPGTAAAAAALLLARIAGPRTYRRSGTIPYMRGAAPLAGGRTLQLSPQEYFKERESERFRQEDDTIPLPNSHDPDLRRSEDVLCRTCDEFIKDGHIPGCPSSSAAQPLSLVSVAKSASPEVLEHLVATLAGKSATSDSRYLRRAMSNYHYLGQAIEVLDTIGDNPAISDDLYDEARRVRESLERAKDEMVKEDAIRKEAARRAALKEDLSRRYKESTDALGVGLRHARAKEGTKAAKFLPRELVEAALASSTDPEEIRALAAFAAGDLPREEAASRRKDEDTLNWETARLVRFALENPATPSDALEDILLNSEHGSVDEDVFTDLLEHPHATPEQKTRVAAIRAKGAERKRDAFHREECDELGENVASPDDYSGAGNLWSVADNVARYDRSTEADLENVLRAAQNVRGAGGWYHALNSLLEHPNATLEQKARATELLRQSGQG